MPPDCHRRFASLNMTLSVKLFAVVSVLVGVVAAHDYHKHEEKKCYDDWAQCAYPPKMKYGKDMPCCSDDYACMEKKDMKYEHWGLFCVQLTKKNMCYKTGEKCKSHGYHQTAPYSCCDPRDKCILDPRKGWEGYCERTNKDEDDMKDHYSDSEDYKKPYHPYHDNASPPQYEDYKDYHYNPPPKYGDYGSNGGHGKYDDYGSDDGYGKYGEYPTKPSKDYGKKNGGTFCGAGPGDALAVDSFPFISSSAPTSSQTPLGFQFSLTTDSCGNSDLTANSLTLQAAVAASNAVCGAASQAVSSGGGSLVPGSCGITGVSTGSIIIGFTFSYTGTIANIQAVLNALAAVINALFGATLTPAITDAPSPSPSASPAATPSASPSPSPPA